MNLEQLTKHQIVLLALLISFVTSIATGIVTVSLMDQAPQGVTKVVNQIVEHTVERVIPSTQGASVVTTEKTVVVKDDDLAAQSIATVQTSMVRVTVSGSDLLVTRGVIIDAKGTAIVDKGALVASGAKSFDVLLPSGERVGLTVRSNLATTSAISIVDIAVGTTTGWAPAILADVKKLSLGQSVIRIGGKGADSVAAGVVATLPNKDTPDLIEASVVSGTPGAILMTLFGEIIGITTGTSQELGGELYSLITIPAPPPVTPTASQ